MLTSRSLNRRFCRFTTYRPAHSAATRACHPYFALQQRSHFSSAFASGASSTASTSGSPNLYTFIMHRLNSIAHSLSSAPHSPTPQVSTPSAASHTPTRSPILPELPPANVVHSHFPASLEHVIKEALAATQTTSMPQFSMRAASSTSTSSSGLSSASQGFLSDSRKSSPSFVPPKFRFDYGKACIPHADKRNRNPDPDRELCSSGCGEDSVFMNLNALAVADGVGGWANKRGADSAKVSRLLTHYCCLKIDENRRDGVHSDPIEVIQHALLQTQTHRIMGTATFCLVVCEGDHVYTANIGDSGFVLIRNGDIVRKSTETTWAFNAPHQIGYPPRSSSSLVESSTIDSFPVKENDVFILMTDGVLDNLHEHELLDIVKGGFDSPHSLANNIAQAAHKFSLSRTRKSPFTLSAASYGHHYPGGKEDDIAVVVGIIAPRDGELEDDSVTKSKL